MGSDRAPHAHARLLPRVAMGLSAAAVIAVALFLATTSRQGTIPTVEARGPARVELGYIGANGGIFIWETNSAPRAIAAADRYGIIRLSPDGRTLAAVVDAKGASEGPRLKLIDVASGKSRSIDLDKGPVAGLEWSPTARVVAVVGVRVQLVDSSGHVVATSSNHSSASGQTTSIEGGGFSWSPDGGHFGAVAGGYLVVLGLDGSIVDRAPSDGATGGDRTFVGWTISGSSKPVVGGANGLTAESASPSKVDPASVASVVDREVRAADAAQALKAPGLDLVWSRSSAGGAVAVSQRADSRSSTSLAVVSLTDPAEFATVTGLPLADPRGGALVDATILH